MSKTYTITPSINAGRRDSLADYWTNFMQGDNGGLVVGYSKYGYTSNQYRAVNFLLSASDKAQFSGKTITSIVLRIKVSSGTIGSVNYAYRVRYKYNDVATTTSSSDAWSSGNAEGTAYSDTDIAVWSNGQSSGTTTIPTNTVHDFDLGTTLPANGYVLAGTRSMVAYMILAEASIIVTTNETQKTLSYNANGGANPPATQTGYSNPNTSYTFTVSNSQPTRTGFEFVNWNTASDGSGTSKTGGQTIAVSSSTTLYAQWNALKSTLNTISAGTIGSTVTVSWTAKGSFQHKLKFTLGSSTTSEVTISAGTNSYTFSIPSSWLNQLPTTTSGTATATLTTLVDGSSIGTDSKSFTVNVASSVVPSIGTVTATKVNTNPTVSAWDIYLQSYSQVQITANSLTAGTGASLASIRFTGQNMDTTLSVSGTSANATSNTITASGSLTYTVKLTDSRGRTATKTVSISVTAYQPPTVTSFQGWRCDADGTVNPITGESLKANVQFTYTQVGTNAITNTLSYKKTTDQYYTTAGTNVASNSTTLFAVGSADVASTYNVQFYIVDSLGASSTLNITISSVVGIAFGLKNDRARFGGAVRQAGLEVDWDTQFDGDVEVQGDLTVGTKPVVLTVNNTSPDANGNVNVSGGGSSIIKSVEGAISSAGWYRVITYDATSSANALGGHGTMVRVDIQKHTASENHSITLRMASSSNIIWCDESSHSGTKLIDKIRYNANGQYGYIDIHFTGTVSSGIGIDFTIHESNNRASYIWTTNDFVSVADTPTGETIVATHTFMSDGFVPNQPILTSYGDLSQMGEVLQEVPSAVSVASATNKTVASITMSTGWWMILWVARFANNATGMRLAFLSSTADSSSRFSIQGTDASNAVDGDFTFLHGYELVQNTSQRTLYLNAYQNSGSSMNVYARIYAFKVIG